MNSATTGTVDIHMKHRWPAEPLWPPVVAMLAVGGLYAALPPSLLGGAPRWLLVAIIVGLLASIVISHRSGNHYVGQVLGYVLNSAVTLAMIVSLTLLLKQVTEHQVTPPQLLVSAAAFIK